MITAKFFRQKGEPVGFLVSGHAGYADAGEDIVCAAVTSAVELTANAVTELLRVPARLEVTENQVLLELPKACAPEAVLFLKALRLQLKLIREDYSECISVSDVEV